MSAREKVVIVRESGVAIYGRVINASGKIGLFEVYSDYWGSNGEVYALYSEAERRMDQLIGVNKKKDENKAFHAK